MTDKKAILVIGAGDATGGAIARRFAREGYIDRKSTRLNSSHGYISYAVFCLKKKKTPRRPPLPFRAFVFVMRENQINAPCDHFHRFNADTLLHIAQYHRVAF